MVRISLVPSLTPLYLYVSTFRSMCAVPNMAVLLLLLLIELTFVALFITITINTYVKRMQAIAQSITIFY
jgi:hypothetical protein